MATERHHFKVGIFVVVLTAGLVAFLVWVGSSGFESNETVEIGVYFDESVQGLSEGSEVKYRGFKVGEVTAIAVASDRKHLEVLCVLSQEFLTKMGESTTEPGGARSLVARLASSGLTGLKFVEIDLTGPVPVAPYELPPGIKTPEHVKLVLPSLPSTLESLERGVADALEAIHVHGPHVGGILAELNTFLAKLNESNVTKSATDTIGNLDTRIRELDTKGLSDSAKGLFDEVGVAVNHTNDAIQQLTSEGGDLRRTVRQIETSAATLTETIVSSDLPGTCASVRDGAARVGSAADAVADAANQISGIAGELDLTLRSVRATVDELRGLLILLEQDPSSLLFGRQYRSPPVKRDG